MSPRATRPAQDRAERILHLFDRGQIGGFLRKPEEAVDLPVLLALKREVEKLVRVDARRALRLATVMERLLPLIADPKARAVATRAKAEALLFLGRYQMALETYEEAVRLYAEDGDALEGARASIAEIPTLAYLSRYDEALTVAKQAESVLRRHGERLYLGRLYMNKGNLFFHMDRYREALRYYRKARQYLRLISGRDETVVGLEINEGVIYTDLDDAKAAEKCLSGAIERARTMGWTSLAAQAEFNIGRVFALDSRYQEALAALARASHVFEQEDRSLAAIADATRAEIYLRLNMSREAIPLAQSAITRFRAEGMRYDEGLAIYTLAGALAREGRLVEGARRLTSARAFFAREGNHVRTAVIDLHLARLAVGRRRWQDARRLARLAERSFATLGLSSRAAAARLARAEVEVLTNNPRSAGRLLGSMPPLTDHLARFEKAFLSGRVFEARGDLPRALTAYRRAGALADTVRAALVGEEHKIAVEAMRAEVADRAIAVLLDGPDHLAARDEQVFEFVEGAKARALGDLLDGLAMRQMADGPVRGANPASWAARGSKLETASRRLAWCSGKLERRELEGKSEPGHNAAMVREVERLERQVALLHRREREAQVRPQKEAADPGRTRRPDSPSLPPLSLTSASRLLGAGEVFIEYFAANDRIHVFRIDSEGARIVPLSVVTHDVDRLSAAFGVEIDTMRMAGPHLGSHAGSLVASATKRLRDFHDLLIAPLGGIPEGTHLTIVPHGALHAVPFGALEGPDGPLLLRATVALVPSFEIFARLRSLGASRHRIDLVGGYADPCAPEIAHEIEAVASALAGKRLLLRQNLSSSEFLSLAPRARRVHLATHGRFRRDNPLFSALRFADRWVHLYEILNLDLDADLVVLSGCETGVGRRTAGEEMLGLARGFLARGARRLLVSLWPVDDSTAGKVISLFYRAQAESVSAPEAIRRAALAVRNEFPHPYHWSPFTLLGAAHA